MEPHNVPNLSHKEWIGRQLERRDAMRCSANARQMRLTADWDIPQAWAMVRVDQCVPCGGVDSKVRVISSSMCASEILRGASLSAAKSMRVV